MMVLEEEGDVPFRNVRLFAQHMIPRALFFVGVRLPETVQTNYLRASLPLAKAFTNGRLVKSSNLPQSLGLDSW